ncbi:pilus assembly protein CpaB [Gracilibacillus ureilyticus]|uniref:Pilus assembly protein CpaB n=1 Tax=Gracilibacillus ureilyticus TaxID=531814 RepID=A0A1H9VJA2_9BACI|nr:SAF domain-containing protein [Gracilibacillus ureilyticus]SES21649.1 pilus assembly protein CpaB [Gracilibacillus ureilyticus]
MFESKRRALIFITLSFILAILAGILFYNNLNELNADLGEMSEVFVVEQNINSRERISADQIATIEIPNRYVTDAHVLSMEQIEGQVSIIPLKEGDFITQNILRPFTELTDEGNRLVELLEDNSKVFFDDELQHLDRVDIVVSQSFNEEPVTEIFMSDVLVQKVISSDNGEGVALEVSRQQAPELIHMQHYADNIHILKSTNGNSEMVEEDENTEEVTKEVAEETEEGSSQSDGE